MSCNQLRSSFRSVSSKYCITRLFALSLLHLIVCSTYAQRIPIKFGDFRPSEIKMKSYSKDQSAHAVVLCDYGVSKLLYSPTERKYQLLFKRHLRIKIFDKEAYDLANFKIPIYHDENSREKISSFKAVTYNWEEGKREAKKSIVTKDDFFIEKSTKYWDHYKFTMPNTKEGSIIEVKYTIASDFVFNLQEWNFQYSVPVIWTEYHVSYPEFCHYNVTVKGYEDLDISEHKLIHNVNKYRWAKADMPAFKEEAYISSTKNYLTAIKFEIASIKFRRSPVRSYTQTWDDIYGLLLRDSEFGILLNKTKFIRKKVTELTATATTDREKAIAIHNFVKTHMKWNGYKTKYANTTLKEAYNEQEGNSADINLLLTLMLKEAGLYGKPVILSTRGHGIISPVHPSIRSFNYVVAGARIDNNYLLLDATNPYLPIGVLPEYCLNGKGKMLTKAGLVDVPLIGNNKHKTKIQLDLVLTDEHQLAGNMKSISDDYAALQLREKISQFTSQDNYQYDLEKEYPGLEIVNKQIDNLDHLYKPVVTNFDLIIEDKIEEANDLLYFNPMLYFGENENPFKLEQRSYPVDFSHPIDFLYSIRFKIPDDYIIDEIPDDYILSMENDDTNFTYRAIANNDLISITSRLKINNTLFLPANYENLKEFYNLVIKKHAEQIVLKKKP